MIIRKLFITSIVMIWAMNFVMLVADVNGLGTDISLAVSTALLCGISAAHSTGYRAPNWRLKRSVMYTIEFIARSVSDDSGYDVIATVGHNTSDKRRFFCSFVDLSPEAKVGSRFMVHRSGAINFYDENYKPHN